MQITLKQTTDFLRNCDNVYILTHQSPDGDTICSAYGLYHILAQLGKRSKVLCSDEIPARYDFITSKYHDEDFEPECIIAVDVADRNLLGSLNEKYGDRVNLCIDHHISNLDYAEKTYLVSNAAANCENIYKVAVELLGKCTDDIAECVYTGIVTDSGCFKYSCTTSETHLIAAHLMTDNSDVNYSWISRHMDIKSKGRIMAEQEILKRAEYFLDDTCAVACITLDMMNQLNLKSSDLEGIAGILMQIENIKVGITMKEKSENVFKISLRSADEVNVSEVCKTFGGGGHVNAAGCKISGTADEIIKKLVAEIKLKLQEKSD